MIRLAIVAVRYHAERQGRGSMEWKTRAAGRTELHVSTWAAHEHARRLPPGTEVKVYKRGQAGWQLQETITTGEENRS